MFNVGLLVVLEARLVRRSRITYRAVCRHNQLLSLLAGVVLDGLVGDIANSFRDESQPIGQNAIAKVVQ